MIKAIETKYKGYRFRSRTEARWAVFFDAVGARWDYEFEGYDLPECGRYLPDFVVHDPGRDYLVEIKGDFDTEDGLSQLYEIEKLTGTRCFLLCGQPNEFMCHYVYEGGALEWYRNGLTRRFNSMGVFYALVPGCIHNPDAFWLVSRALEKAMSARFEFGENGE
jgi:hypothetical protein